MHSSVAGAAPSVSSPKAEISMDDVIEVGSAPRLLIMVPRVTPVVASTDGMSIITTEAAAAAVAKKRKRVVIVVAVCLCSSESAILL